MHLSFVAASAESYQLGDVMRMGMGNFRAVGLAFGLGLMAQSAAALTTVEVSSFDNGWYRSDGQHDPNNTNIVASEAFGFRNFFAFDLSNIVGEVVSATLTIEGDNGSSFDLGTFATYSVFDVDTPVTDVISGNGGISAYDDFGSGTLLGTTDFDVETGFGPVPEVQIALLSALRDVNLALGGQYVVGGQATNTSFLWGNSGGIGAATLHLEVVEEFPAVPLPAGLPLMATAFGGLFFVARRRRQSA